MTTGPATRIGWKKELAALCCGLLVGSAWEAAHAGVRSPSTHAIARPAASSRS